MATAVQLTWQTCWKWVVTSGSAPADDGENEEVAVILPSLAMSLTSGLLREMYPLLCLLAVSCREKERDG